MVSVRASSNPSREGSLDVYWVHAALKDVSIWERVWSELNIDRVNANVRIGVERFFASAIPRRIKELFEVQRRLLDAIARGERNIERLRFTYRQVRKGISITPSDILDLFMRLVSGDFFRSFVMVDSPFVIDSIEPVRRLESIVPEAVKVNVQTDLNFRRPIAKGNLCFNRKNYVDAVSEAVKELIPGKRG